jgi:hypothetical protein
MANFKVKVTTEDLTVREVRDDDSEAVLCPENPPETKRVATVDLVRDNAFGGCWYVHDNQARVWWGWPTRQCEPLPELMLKIDGRATLGRVAYKVGPAEWVDLEQVLRTPEQPVVRLTLSVETDTDFSALSCHYVVIGGKAYKICS